MKIAATVVFAICFIGVISLLLYADINLGIAAYEKDFIRHEDYYQGCFAIWGFFNFIIVGIISAGIAGGCGEEGDD